MWTSLFLLSCLLVLASPKKGFGRRGVVRIIIIFNIIISGKCDDGSKPTCADGSKPTRKPPCPEGRPKTCADGSTPSRAPGSKTKRSKLRVRCKLNHKNIIIPETCDDGSKPTCSDGSDPVKHPPCPEGRPKTCIDGSTPSKGSGGPTKKSKM